MWANRHHLNASQARAVILPFEHMASHRLRKGTEVSAYRRVRSSPGLLNATPYRQQAALPGLNNCSVGLDRYIRVLPVVPGSDNFSPHRPEAPGPGPDPGKQHPQGSEQAGRGLRTSARDPQTSPPEGCTGHGPKLPSLSPTTLRSALPASSSPPQGGPPLSFPSGGGPQPYPKPPGHPCPATLFPPHASPPPRHEGSLPPHRPIRRWLLPGPPLSGRSRAPPAAAPPTVPSPLCCGRHRRRCSCCCCCRRSARRG